jgi:serine/threonine-protein kinase
MQRHNDLFGQVAVNSGLVTPGRLQEALRIQEEQRNRFNNDAVPAQVREVERLGEIFLRQGWLDQAGLARILRIQAKLRVGRETPSISASSDTNWRSNRGKESKRHLAVSTQMRQNEGDERKERRTDESRCERSLVVPENDATPHAHSPGPTGSKRGRRLGDFELLNRLGQGAMSAVYLALWKTKNIKVALKVLPPALARDQEFLERFRREARVIMRLQHPNIVRAHHVGVADGYHYIAMEYVSGRDLESIVEKEGRLPPEKVLRIARETASALSLAASEGIVHRDIKPANIMMTEDGTSKLADLGLVARSAGDERVTQTGVAVGTPYYIAPEQATGEAQVDTRADIYSLGATLYHLAVGRPPYPGDNPVLIMTQHIREPLIPPCEVEPSVPQGLSRLIEKMMAKKPTDRYASPEALLADIAVVEKGGIPGEAENPGKRARQVHLTDLRSPYVSVSEDSQRPKSSLGTKSKRFIQNLHLWEKIILVVSLIVCVFFTILILSRFLK